MTKTIEEIESVGPIVAEKLREKGYSTIESIAISTAKELSNSLNIPKETCDKIIKDASAMASKIREEAKGDASKITEKMIEDAKHTISLEKQAAINEIRNQVAEFSIMISEKILRKNLSGDKKQKALIAKYMKDLNLN